MISQCKVKVHFYRFLVIFLPQFRTEFRLITAPRKYIGITWKFLKLKIRQLARNWLSRKINIAADLWILIGMNFFLNFFTCPFWAFKVWLWFSDWVPARVLFGLERWLLTQDKEYDSLVLFCSMNPSNLLNVLQNVIFSDRYWFTEAQFEHWKLVCPKMKKKIHTNQNP